MNQSTGGDVYAAGHDRVIHELSPEGRRPLCGADAIADSAHRDLLQRGGELSAKLGVTGSPTLLFFKGGREAGERLSGDEIKRTALKSGVEALLV
jgi:hypothetical protein